MPSFEELKKKARHRQAQETKQKVEADKAREKTWETIKASARSAASVGVDERFINTFLTDAQNYLKGANSAYTGMGYANRESVFTSQKKTADDLRSRSGKIRAYLNGNKSSMKEDDYNSLVAMLDDFDKSAASIYDAFSKKNEGISKFKNEDDYNTSVRHYGYQQKYSGKSYEEIQSVIGTLPDGEEKEWLSTYQYELLPTATDFDSKSTAGWEKYLADQQAREQAQKEAREDESFWDKFGRWLGPTGAVDTSIPLGNAPEITHNLSADTSYLKPGQNWTDKQKGVYGYLYDSDKTAAGLYAKNTTERNNQAENAEKIAAIEEWATQNGLTMAASTLGAIATMPLSLADTLSALTEYNARGFISTSAAPLPGQVSNAITSAIASTLNGVDEEGVAHNVINENIPVIGGKGWGDAYQLGTSIANSMITAHTQGPLGTYLVFFGSASASGMYDAKNRGATDSQAITLGILNGLAEAAGEAFSAEKLLGLAGVKELKSFFVNILLQAGIEASEEGVTTLLNTFADEWVMKDKSNYGVTVSYYMNEKGMSREEAEKQANKDWLNDIAFDMVGGFISGASSAGLETGVKTMFVNHIENLHAKDIYGTDPGALVNEALEINPDNAFAQKMQGRLDRGKQLSGGQLNRLVQQNEAALAAQDLSSIQSAAETRLTELGETGDVSGIAAALAKQVKYQYEYNNALRRFMAKQTTDVAKEMADEQVPNPLSRSEKNAIAGSKYGQRVANELNTENIQSGDYSSEWAQKLDTNRINVQEYSRLVEAAQLPQETADVTGIQVTTQAPKAAQAAQADLLEAPTETIRENRTVEVQPESQYEVSAEGKAIDKKGNDVNIVGVESTADGKLVLKTEEGTIDSSEVLYASKADALIYEAVASMGARPASAWTMINSFKESDGVSAQDYATLLPLAYKYGKINYRKGLLNLDLTPKQSSIAFQMGREDAAAAVKPTTQASTKSTLSEKNADKKIIFEGFTYNEKSANDVQKASMAAIDTINKMSSLEIHVYQSVKKNGKLYAVVNGKERLAPNGYFTDGNKIYIDINAGNKGEGMMLYTLSHEIGHYIARYNAQDFKAISDFLFEHYGKDVPIDTLLENQKNKLRKSYETDGKTIPSEAVLEKEAKEELVCDMLSRMMADKNAYDKLMALKKKDLNAFQKLGQAIRKALEKLAKIIGVYDIKNPDFMYAASVENFGEEAFRQLQDLYIKAFVQADANFQAAEAQKNTTEDGGVKLQSRMTDADIQAVQGIGRISVNQFSSAAIKATERFARQYWEEMGVKSPFFRAWFGDWRVNDQTKVRIANKKGDTRGAQQNSDTGWDVQVSGQVFAESKHFAKKNKSAMPYLPYINDIVEKAVLLDSYGIDIGKAKSQNSLLMHSLYAIADIGHGPELLKLYVEEMNDPNSSDTAKRAYQLQNIEKASAVNGGVQGNAPSSLANTTNAIRTVADLFAAVKQKDADFKPNAASTVVNADGTPKVVYHGSADQFNIFSYGHIGSASGVSILGDGFYFGDKKRLAKNYGENVYECYLQMKKPYQATEADAYKLNTKKLQNQGYDGVILESPSGKIYMVFDNTQIKSATDNIGSFDGSNADIRYQDRDYQNIVSKAVNQFGTTTDFAEAGFILPSGEMLRFTDDKHRGERQYDHRAIGVVYGVDVDLGVNHGFNKESGKFLDEFVENGGIRFDAGDPDLNMDIGLQLSSTVPITKAQEQLIRGLVEWKKNREELFEANLTEDNFLYDGPLAIRIDFGGNSQYAVGAVSAKDLSAWGKKSLEYDGGNINADRIIADIRHYYKTGETRQQSVVARFRYQERADDSVSNRSLLANAFEGVAQNEVERSKIQEYRDKVALMDAEERKLTELNNQIKELSFAKGPRDTKKIRGLQLEARQTANRISTYDKQLLRLEASKPLQDVLAREKKAAYKRAEQKGKEALEAYREKALKQQMELTAKWQESRKKGIDSRNRTAMRHKIKDIVNELNQYLLRGTKDRHVPIELQKAVAEALDAVNMDTVGAEERIAKLKDELLKAKTPEQIQEISRKIDHIQAMGDKMNGRLQKLKDAYDQFVNSDDPLIANSHDEVISNKLQSVIDSVGNTPLRDMTFNQLEDVYDMYRMVLTTIRNANKAFKAKKNESISTIANQVMVEVEKVGGKQKQSLAMLNGIKNFGWNNLKPVYAFEHIGSDHFTEVFNNVRAGEDVWAMDVTEAREFYLDKSKKYRYDSWDLKKRYKFKSTSGMDFELDLEQIMSLYAYSKRDQAADHLNKGGIVFDESTKIIKKTKMGISLEFNPTEATAYNISTETLADIVSKLTNEQKSFVDEMQEYLSTVMGAKGNEVSLEMYGVKLFKEKFYFPLKSAQQFMAKAKEQQKGEVKIKNSGFSKETVQKASNPIVLTPFMNVWADHVNEMSMYHAFVLPMEDFYRVYNYKTPTSDTMATESVEMFIQNAYGKGATKYIDQLLKDLNGGARTDHTTGFINKMMGLFKKGSVFASLSVVVQQPSAIARAAALVDTKYFIGPKVDHKRHKALWDEVKQYAPVAIIKEMGYFDTNMGKSTQDFIMGKEYSGFKDKMSALVKDSNYRDEVLSKAPALADEIAWCSIWEAVKRETQAKNPGMDVKSKAFLNKVGERFTEVIVKTQVYDSVLSRSGMMRSKDTGMKMATAFMAEPTTSINMVADALLQGKRGNRKYARAAIGAVIASQILNSILVSFVYAGIDDDEDETYLEKYIGTLLAETLDGLNPLTYIPFIKDIVSIVKGYDVERSDMAVIGDLWKAWENLSKDNVSAYRKVEGFAGSIAQIFGLPVKNIMRDARGIYETIDSFVNGQQTTAAGVGHAVKGAITGKDVTNSQQLYEAYLNGDAAQIARVKSRFEDEKAAGKAMSSAIKEHYMAGDIDADTAMQYLEDYCGLDADDAYWKVDAWEYASDTGSSEDYSKYSDFYAAVETGKNLKAVIKEYTDNGVTTESLASQITSHFKPQYIAMAKSERASINGYLRNAMIYCGMNEADATERLRHWNFIAEFPGYSDLSESAVTKYYESVKSSGISVSVYYKYCQDKADYSKKNDIMNVINALPITSAQKDALYLAEGWASSKLYDAPWH